MLARYRIIRGKRPPGEELPNGIRQDTRKHTKHCLRPSAEIVTVYLEDLTPEAWEEFKAAYLGILKRRYNEDRSPFDKLAHLATENDVYIGCSCPTAKNPNVNHCHTVVALRFMKARYPDLAVKFP